MLSFEEYNTEYYSATERSIVNKAFNVLCYAFVWQFKDLEEGYSYKNGTEMPMPCRQQLKRLFQWDFLLCLIFISSICSLCVITIEKNSGMPLYRAFLYKGKGFRICAYHCKCIQYNSTYCTYSKYSFRKI